MLKVNEIYGNVPLMWLKCALGKEVSSLQAFLRLSLGFFAVLSKRHKVKKVLSPFDLLSQTELAYILIKYVQNVMQCYAMKEAVVKIVLEFEKIFSWQI